MGRCESRPVSVKGEIMKTMEKLFDELVPAEGKADTVAGEIVRAFNRIGYRNNNDGDHIGVGYGNETCNAAARYLQITCHGEVEAIISDMWGMHDDAQYDEHQSSLEIAVIAHLENHPELKTAPNATDMFDFALKEDLEWEDEDEEDDW